MNNNLTKRPETEMFGPCLLAFKFKPKRGSNNGEFVQEIGKYNRQNADKQSIDAEYLTRNFPNVTNSLEYGILYNVFLFPIIAKDVTFTDCIAYMKKNKYMFAGSSVYPAMLRESDILAMLPRGKWMMSLDVEGHCFNSQGINIFHCLRVRGGLSKKEANIEIQPSTCISTFDGNYILVCVQKA